MSHQKGQGPSEGKGQRVPERNKSTFGPAQRTSPATFRCGRFRTQTLSMITLWHGERRRA